MRFEEVFFGPGNRLRWDAIRNGTLPQETRDRLGPFLERLDFDAEVLCLPRVRDDARVEWYVLCDSPQAARIVRDELLAFLGPSYTTFDGRTALLDSADSIDAAVLSRHGSNVFRLEVPQRDLFEVARQRLRLLLSLRKERPLPSTAVPRPIGRLLRDFELALLTRSSDEARLIIDEIRAESLLSPTNLLFLEVRRLAADRQWNAIMALAALDAIVAMPRPKRVTEAIVCAIYETRLRRFEERRQAEEAVSYFRQEVYPRFRDVYASRATLSGGAIDASFLLAAAAADPPRVDLAADVLGGLPGRPAEDGYLTALARLIGHRATRTESPLAVAKRAFGDAEVDEAFSIAVGLPASFDRSALLLRCALEIGTLAAAREALTSLASLSSSERKRLADNSALVRILDSLSELTAQESVTAEPAKVPDDIPANWADWLTRLTSPNRWAGAVATAEAGAREWDVDAFATDHVLVEKVSRLILEVETPWGVSALRDSLPYLLEFCTRGGADPRLRPVYENLFVLMAMEEYVSVPHLAAFLQVTEARLRLGVSSAEYREATRHVSSAIRSVNSPAVATVALDAIEMLVGLPCPGENDRQTLVADVASVFKRWHRWIGRDQAALLQILGGELGVPLEVVVTQPGTGLDAESDNWAGLRGQRIALYSLNESALRRAAAVLRSLCPEVKVETYHDHVGSPSLKTAAIMADVFVIATAAAKHAATTFIEANRPRGRPIRYARGQGSSSLFRALDSYLGGADSAGDDAWPKVAPA